MADIDADLEDDLGDDLSASNLEEYLEEMLEELGDDLNEQEWARIVELAQDSMYPIDFTPLLNGIFNSIDIEIRLFQLQRLDFVSTILFLTIHFELKVIKIF